MPLPPLLAAEAAGKAQKALTGDIYTRRWVQKPKKGKHKGIPIEHEVRVNALTGAIVGVGVATTGLLVGVAAWMMHQKLEKKAKVIIRRIRRYEADPHRTVIMTARGVPVKTVLKDAPMIPVSPEFTKMVLGTAGAADITSDGISITQGTTGEDQIGPYYEWTIAYTFNTKQSFGFAERTGFLE